MPRKRGGGKGRRDLPALVVALIEGLPIEPSIENHDALAAIKYFDDYADQLDEAARSRVVELLDAWRKRHVAGTLPREAP